MPFSSKNLILLCLALCVFSIANSSTSYAWTLDCSTVNIPQNECEALRDLYDSTNGSGWALNSGWGSSTDVSTRDGVQIYSSGGSVRSLQLNNNNLSGTLPGSLSGLSAIKSFDVSSNSITGTLSDSRSSWTSLDNFNIQGNRINGVLPDSRSSWTAMISFNAGDNQLSGSLADSRSSWSLMQTFNVSNNNKINGVLPASRSGWTSMTSFNAANNYIVGNLPSSWSTWTALLSFSVRGNQLTGVLPDSRSGWTSIANFYAFSNQLIGNLPDSRSSWTAISNFSVGSNQLIGMLPDSRSSWTAISSFSANSNQLIGMLPDSRSSWSNIYSFSIGSNQLTGVLPDSRSGWVGIHEFSVASNQLTGVLPDSRSSWTAISNFYINLNELTGVLPDSRSSWSGIDFFDISNNQLHGTFPASRGSWSGISNFYAVDNQFIGTLPSSRSSWTTIYAFSVDRNKLSGILPDSRSSWVGIGSFLVSNNFLTGFIPDSWTTNWTNYLTQYILSNDNCMQTTGYAPLVQIWVDANVSHTPQNDCNIIPPTILSPNSGQVLTTGSVIISGTGESGFTITMIVSGTTFTGIIDGSGLRSFSFSNMNNGNYAITAFQTNPLSTYDSNNVGSPFSIAIPLPPVPIPTPTGGGGGGGGGGRTLNPDNCPNGDQSASYYDGSCGITNNPTNTNNTAIGTTAITKKQCAYDDGSFFLYKTTMTDIDGKYYKGAVEAMLDRCLIHGKNNEGTLYRGKNLLNFGGLYKIMYRLTGKPIKYIPKTQKHWSDIYYREGKKLGLRKDLPIPSSPNIPVTLSSLKIVVRNILEYQGKETSNSTIETILERRPNSSSLVTRGDFAMIILELLK